MFKLNLKIALRNLLKNKAYTVINVFGLALGLAGSVFILLYINYEKSYDHWDPGLENVYQVQEIDHWAIKDGKEEWMDVADKRLVNLFQTSMPQAGELTRVGRFGKPRSIILQGKEPFLQDEVVSATASFFKVFPFQFIYGDANTAFQEPGSIVIKESVAEKYFGKVNPVGKVIQINEQNWTKPDYFTITGVVAEPKTPGSVNFEILQFWEQAPASDRTYSFAETYMTVKGKPSLNMLNKTAQSIYFPFKAALLKRQHQNMDQYVIKGMKPAVRIVPLNQLHQHPLTGKSWLVLIKPIILLSALLLLISIINFINMFTAQAVSRGKEVGIKKVIGAHKRSLILQFLSETALQCFIALMLGIVLLEVFLPYLNNLFELSLSIKINLENSIIAIQLFLLLMIVTLMGGVYPAFFMSSYRPQLVLKGNFVNSTKGKTLRSLLVGLQFVIAVGFLTGIMIISRQISYMENKDPGFNAASSINLNVRFDKRIAQQIKHIEGVKYVGFNNGMISENQGMTGMYKYKGESKELNTVLVNAEGLQALDVRLISGRLFEANNAQDSLSSVILNESLEKAYGGNMVGKFIYVNDTIPAQVVGVIKDIRIAGFDQVIQPTVYTAAIENATGYPNSMGVNYVVKFDANKQRPVLAAIEEIWKRQYPAYPFTYTFVQDDLAKVLVAHHRFQQMVKIFSFLSIALSLIGLFSLAAFLTKQRTKEIAIRKILGADHKILFLLLNKGYIWMMMGANVLSWPLIYIVINYWLKEFAYRIEMPVYPFLTAFFVSILATIITVSLQVRNAVKANPVVALKYE